MDGQRIVLLGRALNELKEDRLARRARQRGGEHDGCNEEEGADAEIQRGVNLNLVDEDEGGDG